MPLPLPELPENVTAPLVVLFVRDQFGMAHLALLRA